MTMSVLELRLFSGDRRIVDSIISQLGFLNKNNTLLLHDSGLVTQTHFRCTEHWQKVIKRSGISWWLVWAKSAKNFSGTRVTSCDFDMQKHLRGNFHFITCSKATHTEVRLQHRRNFA
ncbi:uncharacterized protein LOC110930561 isoform X2 [Helianthus annuus]|uniref:uncharacterized protein LOC110930561 isoform X2 n=1 Tax=Helianthus annuus TaxID=4232 RepID=UPI000B902074|nr:uncharacterized protein LOC110930561 isoform X2 [Helianthus annuus]